MRAPAVLAFAVVVFASLAVAPAVFAEEWPQFRGPTGQGHSTETGLPLNWSDTQNVRWKTAVPGRGWSSPVVVGGRVWLTTATRDGGGSTLRALAYDAGSGKELVNAEVFSLANAGAMHAKNSHASPTPLVEDQRVYVHFGNHGTAALDWSGKVLWKRQIPYQPVHGTGGSPVLSGDLLIYSADGGDTQFVIALDKRTGEVRWKSARPNPGGMALSTPMVTRGGGRVRAHRFLRVNRNILVNLGRVREVTDGDEVVLPSGRLPVSRRRREDLLKGLGLNG